MLMVGSLFGLDCGEKEIERQRCIAMYAVRKILGKYSYANISIEVFRKYNSITSAFPKSHYTPSVYNSDYNYTSQLLNCYAD